ncbi:hypothetical protein GpartN1_g1041.t1 [Galdieria partita]|uniref:PHD-type domain-containing protein n=1 Tax=Galdieria partita TaxID=83374 RepID=A0A9C7UN86_9RHOD|nr:hypothetical protein GpartN1_g1041.t1 [Galdieria partita]
MDDGDEKPYHRREGVESGKGLASYLSRLQKQFVSSQFTLYFKSFVEIVDSNHKERLDNSAFVEKQGEQSYRAIEETDQDIRKTFLQMYDRFYSEFQRSRGLQGGQQSNLDREDATQCVDYETSTFCPGCHKAFRTTLGLEIHQRSCQEICEEVVDPKESFPLDKITCNVCGVVCKTPFGLVIHQKKCKRLSETTGSNDSSLSDIGKTKEESSMEQHKIFYCGVCKEPAGRDFRELKKHQLFCSKGRKDYSQNSGSMLPKNQDCNFALQESSKDNHREQGNSANIQNTGYADSDYHNCEYCGLLCRTLLGLSVHQRKCEERRRQLTELYGPEALNEVHTCENCGRQCVSLYGLRIHQRKCFNRSSNTDAMNQEHIAKRPRSNYKPERTEAPDAVTKNSLDVASKKCQLSCALCPSATASSGNFDDFVGPFMNNVGRPGKSSLYVHVECALWAPEVYQDRVTKELCQVYDAYRRSRKKICDYCGEFGAPVPCLHKGCKKSYHYCCLTKANCFLDSSRFEAFCVYHTPRNDNVLSSLALENNNSFNSAQQETVSSTIKSHMTVEQREICQVIFSRKFKVISQIVFPEKLPHQFVLPWREHRCLNLKQVVNGDAQLLVLAWTQFYEHVDASPLLCGNESFFLRRNLRKYTRKSISVMQLRTLAPSSQNNLHCEVNLFERRKASNSCTLRNRRKCTKVRHFCWTLQDDSSGEFSVGFSEKTGQFKHDQHSYRMNSVVEQARYNESSQNSLSKEERLHLKSDSRKMEKGFRMQTLGLSDRNGRNSSLEFRKNTNDIGLFGGKEHLRSVFADSGHYEKRTTRVDTKTIVPLSTTLSFSKSFGGNSKPGKEDEQLEKKNGKSLRLDDIFSVDLDDSVLDQVCAPPSEV